MSEKEHERGSEEASEESEETTDDDAEERVQPNPLSGYKPEGGEAKP